MYRVSFFLLIIIGIAAASAVPPATNETSRDDRDDSIELEPQGRQLGSLITIIKSQFRDIILEIGLQIIKQVKAVFLQMKVNLLNSLHLYALSDVCQAIFDGISNLLVVTEEVPDVTIAVNPNYVDEDSYVYPQFYRYK